MKRILIYFLFILLFASQQNVSGQTSAAQIGIEHQVSGKIRIKLKRENLQQVNSTKSLSVSDEMDSFGIESLDQVSRTNKITRITRVFPFSLKDEAKHREYGLHLWFELEFDESLNSSSIVDQFSILDEVAIAKPIYKKTRIDNGGVPVRIDLGELKAKNGHVYTKAQSNTKSENSFNDPLLEKQWHYNNTGEVVGNQGSDISLFEAWSKQTGSSDVIVAIVDGGVDTEHEDLMDNLWVNEAEMNGLEGVDDDGNGYVDDFHGHNFVTNGLVTADDHGTHVAGTVAAVNNNAVGIAGVAGGDGSGNGVRMISCQVFSGSGSGNFAAAIVYGADNGAVISQNSWGYTMEGFYEPEVYEAILYFNAEAGQYEGSPMKGGLCIFAAGNDGRELEHYPGAFPEVLAVTATGPSSKAAPYSTYGTWTDIAAPGGDQSNFGQIGGVLSTLPNNGYGYMQGTSMACPHVSGIAGLVVSQFADDNLTGEGLRKILVNSNNRFTFDHHGKFGSGIIDAELALSEDEKIAPDAINDLEVLSVYHNAVELGWIVPRDEDNFQPTTFYLAVSDSEITKDNFDGQTVYQLTNPYGYGIEVIVTLGGLNKQKDYWFAVKSADRYENISEISNIVKGTTTDEPHFMESTRTIHVDIDASDSAIRNFPLTFSNIGEGIVDWFYYVGNERLYFEFEEELAEELDAKATKAAQNPEMATEFSAIPTETIKTASTFSAENKIPDYWLYDKTEFVAGMSHAQENGNYSVMGKFSEQIGLVCATRFDMKHGETFNMTHIEPAIFMMQKEKPIIVEIKKGAELETAERVYVSEHYVQTAGVFDWERIPILRPQRFEDTEVFWVVLHFPAEEENPMGFEWNYYKHGYFLMSGDNGRSFMDIRDWIMKPYVPLLRVASTGDDGSYVFMNPLSGKIGEGEEKNVNVTIDANNLTNGLHLASIGIVTNDVHKRIVNIEVKAQVTGQKSKLNLDKAYKFEVYPNKDNNLTLSLDNTGLAALEIYNIKGIGVTSQFSDTITIHPDYYEGNVPFTYNTDQLGIITGELVLETNEGDISLISEMFSRNSAQLEASLNTNEITISEDQNKEVELSLKNISSDVNLEYDLQHYDYYSASKDMTSTKLKYKVLSSDDSSNPEAPKANQWEDISDFAPIDYTNMWYIGGVAMDLKMKFPLFDEIFDNIGIHSSGAVYFGTAGYYAEELPDYRTGLHTGTGSFPFFLPKNLNVRLVQGFQYHSFGDRTVINIKQRGVKNMHYDLDFEGEITVETQVVLFRNGAVEYRYKKVDNLPEGADYIVAILGMNRDDFAAYRNIGQTETKIHEGLVVRFEPIENVSLIANADTKLGILKPGESVNVTLTVDPEIFGQTEGIYKNKVEVKANTLAGNYLVDLTVNVVGDSQFQVEDSIVFGKCNVGFEKEQFNVVSNIGGGRSQISSVSFNHSDFTCEETFPIDIESHSHYRLSVIYTPSTGNYLSNIMTVNFDNGQSEEVILTGSGKIDPEFVINLASDISVDLNGGEAISVPFSINTQDTGSELDYSFINSVFASVVTDGNLKGEGNNNEALTDDYGYTWEISDSLSRTYHKWEDISDKAELLKPTEGVQTAVKLPFSFPFYGDLFDTIWVSENGYVTVVEPISDGFWTEFEANDGMQGIIAPFKAPLIPGEKGGGVMCLVEEDRVILQWDHFLGEIVEVSGSPATFQLEMLADGTIYFHYDEIARYAGLELYGLESPDESEVLVIEEAYIFIWSNLSDHSTYAINPPLKGQVASGQTTDFELLLSAENIYHSGVYKDTVELLTTSLAQPTISIPVSLNVSGNPILNIEETQTWENVIFTDDLSLKRKIKISNNGFETAEITSVTFDQLDGLILNDHAGNEILKGSDGQLMKAIQVLPWEVVEIELIIPVEQNADVEGQLIFDGNFDTRPVNIIASIVNSPVFEWNGVDQVFENLNNSYNPSFSFTIENKGDSPMDYSLVPAIIPNGDSETGHPGIIEEIGHYTTDAPAVIDSLNLDWKNTADGNVKPMVGNASLAFSTQFVVPDGGMFITHVKIWNSLRSIDEYVRIVLNVGGDKPEEGELIYEQKYIIDEAVSEEWVYFPLKTPVQVEGGTTLFVTACQPSDTKYVGFDITSDVSLRKRSWDGIYSSGSYKYYDQVFEGMDRVYKIRPVTAGGAGLWLELDHISGEIEGGSSVDVTASINASVVEGGDHAAKVLITTNDLNHKSDEFKVDITVNGTPTIKFRPNQYQERLVITETEELLVSYLVEDAEGDDLSISMENEYTNLTAKFTKTGDNTAQVKFTTTYESAGMYDYPVEIADAAGNVVRDTIIVEVKDQNRAPVLNPDFGTITLNLADPMTAFTIDPAKLFIDPDGDEMQILAGNYTPDVVDLALGLNYIDIHPLQEGVGFVVFGADDGKENGYVLYGFYVYVIDDADAVDGARDSLGEEDEAFMESAQSLLVYPNPVINQSSTVQFKMDENADATVEIFNLIGRKLDMIQEKNLNSGVHRHQMDFTKFGAGIYICRYLVNGKFVEAQKVIVK